MSNEEFDQDGQEQEADTGGVSEGQYGTEDESGVDSAFVMAQEKQPLSKGTLAMFLILAVCGAGTYFMYARTGPQSASAAVDPKSQAVIKQFMTDRNKNLGAMQKMLKDTETVVQQFLNYPSVKQVPLSALATNPFRMTATPTEQAAMPKDEERDKRHQEEERIAVLKAVNGLQLQSVMHSDARKSCMINNSLYLEGQQVESFTIERISPNAVIVRNGSYRFELRMQR